MRLLAMLVAGAVCGGVAGTLLARRLVARERRNWGVRHDR